MPCLSALMLHALVKEGLISEYTFFFIPETTSDIQGSKQVLHIHRSRVEREKWVRAYKNGKRIVLLFFFSLLLSFLFLSSFSSLYVSSIFSVSFSALFSSLFIFAITVWFLKHIWQYLSSKCYLWSRSFQSSKLPVISRWPAEMAYLKRGVFLH